MKRGGTNERSAQTRVNEQLGANIGAHPGWWQRDSARRSHSLGHEVLPTAIETARIVAYCLHNVNGAQGYWRDVGTIPDGTIIGYDSSRDARHYHVSPGQVVLVTAEMIEAMRGHVEQRQRFNTPDRSFGRVVASVTRGTIFVKRNEKSDSNHLLPQGTFS